MNPSEQVTRILCDLAAGDSRATGELLELVYDELRSIARRQMANERPGHTLQPTALVHEAYLRLVGDDVRWENRRHFFGAAARAMRRILIDRARRVARLRHGGGRDREMLGEDAGFVVPENEDLLALDEALEGLEQKDPRMHEIVMLRYFGGLEIEEVAKAIGVSDRTVKREWRVARAWLYSQLGGDGSGRAATEDAPEAG